MPLQFTPKVALTARLISKYRPRAEVYAFAHIPVVCNRLNLLWGVRPIAATPFHTVEAMVANTEKFLLETGIVQAGDVVGIVAGTQSTSGSTNFIRLHRVGEHREAGSPTSFAKEISREGG